MRLAALASAVGLTLPEGADAQVKQLALVAAADAAVLGQNRNAERWILSLSRHLS